MTATQYKKRFAACLLGCLMTICFFFLVGKVWGEAKKLSSRNASDTLMLLMELATEGGGKYGGCYTKAQKSHAEMVQEYVGHINEKHIVIPIVIRTRLSQGYIPKRK